MTMMIEKKKKSFIPRFFGLKQRKGPKKGEDGDSIDSIAAQFGDSIYFSAPSSPLFMGEFSGWESSPTPGRVNSSPLVPTMSEIQSFRVFATTWNVGGKPPHVGLDLNDFLPSDDQSDIYVFGFQEIVPLNAGNVLAIEDSEPAVKWLKVINAALNKPQETNKFAFPSTPFKYPRSTSDATGAKTMVYRDPKTSTSLFFQKPNLKEFSKIFKIEKGRRLKTCNCLSEEPRKYYKESCFRCSQSYLNDVDTSEEEEEPYGSLMTDTADVSNITNQLKYSLVASKQMVGIFVTVWVKREHVQHIGHLRVSTVGCGILGYLGNKGCISVSMSLHQTSFCFICSHLASGEKEGDELKRNSDVLEILRSTQFPRICKVPLRRIPERILGHDKIIWLGDLNYRIALSYNETKKLLDHNDWDALLEKDQLKIEREAGRVFQGWNEGNIYFAPTYKYLDNSDAYAGESMTSKKKRRTPAWCDRILWHGDGMEQLSYIRGESRFSDHRPVCSVFKVEVEVPDCRFIKSGSCHNMKVGVEELLPPNTS